MTDVFSIFARFVGTFKIYTDFYKLMWLMIGFAPPDPFTVVKNLNSHGRTVQVKFHIVELMRKIRSSHFE